MLHFITSNPNKLSEVRQIITLPLTSTALDLPEIQGNSQQVTTAKTLAAVSLINGPVLVEDTCLCFNAFNGLPGPYIKWFLKDVGTEGLNRMLEGFSDKSAYALCTFGYCEGPAGFGLTNPPFITDSGHDVFLFEGRTNGSIVEARGPDSFGWDPIFLPDGFSETYAEMEKSVKNTISHRFKALQKLEDFLITQ